VDLFVNADYDFLRVRRTAYLISGVMILVGLVSLVLHGGPNYSIDFEGGLLMRVAFERPVNIGELRSVTAQATGGSPEVTRDIDEEGHYIIRMERLEQAEVEAAASRISAAMGEAFPENAAEIRSGAPRRSGRSSGPCWGSSSTSPGGSSCASQW